MKKCPFCPPIEKLTEWKYEDELVVVCRCLTHPDKWICILRRHTEKPEKWEEMYMIGVMRGLFGRDVKLRGPASILHFHLHEE